MPNIQLLDPSSQPIGTFRLIDWLESQFKSPQYNEFYCAVGFAKIKPFYYLHDSIQTWKTLGKNLKAVVGIDHKGTSLQALTYFLNVFDEVYIPHVDYSTFHPKIYMFTGEHSASLYYGSSNFTTGGLETNFEGGVILDFSLPAEKPIVDHMLKNLEALLPGKLSCCNILDATYLNILEKKDMLMDEYHSTKGQGSVTSRNLRNASKGTGSGGYTIKPPHPISKDIMKAAVKSAGLELPITQKNRHVIKKGKSSSKISSDVPSTASSATIPIVTEGLVIQVNPHKNAEIHLSTAATAQNAAFFGFPFTGMTVPKSTTHNPGYPQRDPDPIVDIYVYDSSGVLTNHVYHYGLNMVYYVNKKEIRITVSKQYLSSLPPVDDDISNYSILVMTPSTDAACDYDLHFYSPGSIEYANYLSVCNQALGDGGKKTSTGVPIVPRKMGWL